MTTFKLTYMGHNQVGAEDDMDNVLSQGDQSGGSWESAEDGTG